MLKKTHKKTPALGSSDFPSLPRRRVLDRASLERRVLSYVARFVSSKGRLTAYIDRLITRWQDNGGEVSATPKDVQTLINQCCKRGYVDDVRFAEVRIGRGYRSGNSRHNIVQKLRAEGLDEGTIKTAMNNFQTRHSDSDHPGTLDRAAAEQYARKRKLGPFRTKDRAEWLKRDMDKMGRRGFSYEDARAVIGAGTEAERKN